jgi:hypothetical protein
VTRKHALSIETAFLENPLRRLMIDVAEGVQAGNLDLSRQGDHRAK